MKSYGYIKKKVKETYLFSLFNKPIKERDIFEKSFFMQLLFKLVYSPKLNLQIRDIQNPVLQSPIRYLSIFVFCATLTNLFFSVWQQTFTQYGLIVRQIILFLCFLGFFINTDYRSLTENSWCYKKIFG